MSAKFQFVVVLISIQVVFARDVRQTKPPHQFFFKLPEGQKPSAHQTAEPYCQRRIKKTMFRFVSILFVTVLICWSVAAQTTFNVAAFDRQRILKAANQYLKEAPITITASHSPRSAGGMHDFFSEGDYWWPDPQKPGAPYIQHDGMT